MTDVNCRLTTKNRDQLRNPALGTILKSKKDGLVFHHPLSLSIFSFRFHYMDFPATIGHGEGIGRSNGVVRMGKVQAEPECRGPRVPSKKLLRIIFPLQ